MGFALALACAALMGFAIQRGSTCTVAAVDEWRQTRRCTRLVAMVEAALCVAVGLWLARQGGRTVALPPAPAPSVSMVLGACLLGLGAVINRACALGTVARLGCGQWAYAATPLGFFAGVAAAARLPPPYASAQPSMQVSMTGLPAALAAVLVAAALWRAVDALRHVRRADERIARAAAWSPRTATAVIGITFVALMLLSGAWAYTDVLADLARGMAHDTRGRAALGAALFAGALAGGWTTGSLQVRNIALADALRCATGGGLMGIGAVFTPGGNDGLVLVGMPMLWPHAWASFAIMVAVIAAALSVRVSRS